MDENDENTLQAYALQLKRILLDLETVRNELEQVNALTGALERYHAMRREIEQTGWAGICAKYHPDINTGDPAAYELFEFYRFIYRSMEKDV